MSEEALKELAWLKRMEVLKVEIPCSEIRKAVAYDTLAENSAGRTKGAYETLAWTSRMKYLDKSK